MFTCELPSGKKVSVEAPSYSHRIESVKEFRPLKDEVGYSVEELMAAKSIAAVDGNTVNTNLSLDPIYLLADWGNADAQYFIEWYMTLFFLDDKIRSRAVDAAKKLMISGDMASSGKSKTSPAKI